jgi:membrane-associated phospholipid phosphatase
LWLQTGGPIEFKWFNPLESGGFPSGHMIIVTAFLTAVWLYYPRFRTSAVVILTILSVALLLTSYHFVSDIIAGVYFGILITVSIDKFFSIIHSDSN